MPITPDTKDWTWVLERPCPECGFDAVRVRDGDIGSMIRENAAVWPSVLARAEAHTRPSDDKWSPLEYACHVRDVFRICDYRLGRMLAEDDPLYANWDQDETAVEDGYDEQDPGVVAQQIAEAAATIAGRFDAVAGDQWQRSGRRSDGARFTVASFGRYLIHDPIHHLWDVGARSLRLTHLALNVRNPEVSRRFYVETLGLAARAQPTEWGVKVELVDGFMLALIRGEPVPAEVNDRVHFGCRLADPAAARAMRARLAAEGCTEVEWEDDESEYVGVKVRDPDGYVVEIACEPG